MKFSWWKFDHLFSCFSFGLLFSDFEKLKKELDELANAIEKYFFEPEKNKLQTKPE